MKHSPDLVSLLKPIQAEADFVSLRYVREETQDRSIRNEVLDRSTSFVDEGVMVEVMRNGHIGYSATSDLSAAGIQVAFKRANKSTESLSAKKVFTNSAENRPASKGRYQSSRSKGLDSLSLSELTDTLIQASKALKVSDKVSTRNASAMIVETEQHYISSAGADIHQDYLMFTTAFDATAEDGKEHQTRSDNGGRGRCYQIGPEVINAENIRMRCEQVGKEAIELLSAPNCPSEKMDLLIMPDQLMLQIHESIGHPLEMDRILGDERNYAGWSFVKPSDFGNLKYGSSLMNVVFDPSVENEFASYAFDDCGNPATKQYLIKDGLLLRGLGSLESQQRLGLQGVANFRSATWSRAPIDRMANINLEAGTSSLQDMIASMERGVIMKANRSWSIDDYRNKFQFGCEYAQLVENGKITKVLKNPNYRGVTVPFWNSLKMVGNQNSWEVYGSPYCGKGEPNQVIRVGHASPACLFQGIEVFGGHGS